MKLELRSIKHLKSLSEETLAYTATVWRDGKRFCHVSNHGQGGSDSQHPIAPFTHTDIVEVNAWLATNMPPLTLSFSSDTLPMDLESWCGEQVVKHETEKELRRMLSAKAVYVDGGKCYAVKAPYKAALPQVIERLKTTRPNARVLNTMPFDAALDLYIETAR